MCQKKLRTLTPEKITLKLKLLYILETCFVLDYRYRYCWKFLAFFLVEIRLFSAWKQTSFRRHIFHSIRTWQPSWVASKMAAKLSFQFSLSSLVLTLGFKCTCTSNSLFFAPVCIFLHVCLTGKLHNQGFEYLIVNTKKTSKLHARYIGYAIQTFHTGTFVYFKTSGK